MEYAGGGGMGAVYRAVDIEQQVIVAVKILKPDIVARNPEYSELFDKEVMSAQRLDHPHIVNVLDRGTDKNLTFMVMEWLEGETLDDVINREKISLTRIVSIFQQICSAFTFAHQHSVIHLDIKPSNIVLTRSEQSEDFIKIIDFGLSRIISRESGTTVTKFRGTHQYCAPEQFGGKVSHRSDIYSLGATLYNLLTGVMPFSTTYINAKIHPNLELPTVPSVSRQCGLPFEIDIVLRKALQKNPTLRHQSANQLFEEFKRAVLQEPKVRQVNFREKNVYGAVTTQSPDITKPPLRRVIEGVLDESNNGLLALLEEKILPKVNDTSYWLDAAPFTPRIAAGFIDLFIVGFISSPFASIIELTNGNWNDPRVGAFMGSIVITIIFLYETFSTELTGRTFAMSLLRLYSIDAQTGLQPTFRQCVRRSLFYILSLLTFGLGFIYALIDAKGRAAHDVLSGTVVMKKYD